MNLYNKCVYVVLDEDRLLDADQGLLPSKPIVENKPWGAVKDWLEDAAKHGQHVAVIMADAKSVNRWLGWAILSEVKVTALTATRVQSTYCFSHLRPPMGLDRSKFHLLKENRPLAEGHIRSYAHLRTPAFLRELAAHDGPLLVDWLGQSSAVAHVFESRFSDAQQRQNAQTVLGRAVDRIQAAAPGNWGAVLTPGRIRLVVGNEEVVDLGNHMNEFLFANEVPSNEEEPDASGTLVEQFDKSESAFVHIVQRLASGPRLDVRHSPAVLDYLMTPASTSEEDAVAKGPARLTNAESMEALRAQVEVQVEAFNPLDEQDGRRRVLGSLVNRQGQLAFRKELLQAYDGRCAITGWAVADVLEAAHIIPFRGEHTNHVTNGLLLRSDLHALFDLHLLQIDPETQSIIIDDRLKSSPYGEMHGTKLRVPADSSQRPSAECLRKRMELLQV